MTINARSCPDALESVAVGDFPASASKAQKGGVKTRGRGGMLRQLQTCHCYEWHGSVGRHALRTTKQRVCGRAGTCKMGGDAHLSPTCDCPSAREVEAGSQRVACSAASGERYCSMPPSPSSETGRFDVVWASQGDDLERSTSMRWWFDLASRCPENKNAKYKDKTPLVYGPTTVTWRRLFLRQDYHSWVP